MVALQSPCNCLAQEHDRNWSTLDHFHEPKNAVTPSVLPTALMISGRVSIFDLLLLHLHIHNPAEPGAVLPQVSSNAAKAQPIASVPPWQLATIDVDLRVILLSMLISMIPGSTSCCRHHVLAPEIGSCDQSCRTDSDTP